MKIRSALFVWLFVFSILPVTIVGAIALSGDSKMTANSLAVCIILLVFSCVFTIKFFFVHLFSFIEQIKKFKPGDYNSRLQSSGKGELAEIAGSFNDFVESLKIKNDQLLKKNKELEEKELQYRFAMGLKSDLYYEVNVLTGALTMDVAKWSLYFDVPMPKVYRELMALAGKLIHPEEFDCFINTFSMINLQSLVEEGKTSVSMDARLLTKDGAYLWSRHTLLLIPDKNAHLVKLIGYMTNIEEQRKKDNEKTIKYQKDGLTNLYTKTVAEKLIGDYLATEGEGIQHALMVLDIDDFKGTNDNYGHLYGDAVLREIATGMSSLFRYSDIVGRIGGDEFVVLLKHIAGSDILREKADALLEMFDSISKSKTKDRRTSGSIGIAVYPKDGFTYNDLFEKADKALYMAKKNGKCSYCFYDQQVEISKIRDNVKMLTPIETSDDSDILCFDHKNSKFNIAEHIFQILYESKDFQNSIGPIMETIGTFCNVSRVYIFQNTLDGKFARYTHEWCADGIRQDIDLTGMLDYSQWGDYKQNFNSDGVFYCPDTSKLPLEIYEGMRNEGVFAFLECAIYDRGDFVGFIGFDECTGKRLWKKAEIDTLILVSRILGIALLSNKR